MLGKIKTRSNSYHDVKITISGSIFQLEINLIEDLPGGGKIRMPSVIPAEIYIDYGDWTTMNGNISMPDNISKEEKVLKDWDINLPFWPPKIEDIEKDSSN